MKQLLTEVKKTAALYPWALPTTSSAHKTSELSRSMVFKRSGQMLEE